MKYFIDYHTGVTEEIEGTLEDAFAAAEEGMAYTQENVTIESENSTEKYISHWYGVVPEEDDMVLMQFGDYGFYCAWEELR
jgi:hypothetical protein|nr:MAG TPA: hypothetical protein [Caudoviricetes sp.]